MFIAIFVLILFVISLKIYFTLTKGICKCSKHLVGKVVIVTGGNSGIGYETARDLAFRGAKVIIACRNEGRGVAARDKIIADTGNNDVQYKNCELASLESVRSFCNDIIATEKRLDILINNAGVLETENVLTEDGLLFGMQINHFGPFLLTNLLLPLLKSSAPSRIINVSSLGHKWGNIDFENLNMEKETKETFNQMKLYSNTKLCNILMTTELSKRLAGTGVTANSLHPGAVETNIMKEKTWTAVLLYFLFYLFLKTPLDGAQTSIYLAVSPEVENTSGRYFVDCKEAETSKLAQDSEVAKSLWEVSEKLVKLN